MGTPLSPMLTDKHTRSQIEDRHMIRLGPMLTNHTFLAMLGPMKAAEIRANKYTLPPQTQEF